MTRREEIARERERDMIEFTIEFKSRKVWTDLLPAGNNNKNGTDNRATYCADEFPLLSQDLPLARPAVQYIHTAARYLLIFVSPSFVTKVFSLVPRNVVQYSPLDDAFKTSYSRYVYLFEESFKSNFHRYENSLVFSSVDSNFYDQLET